MRPIVTLTTDFGNRDAYVPAMKGIILSRCPDAQIVDLTHEIPPASVLEGALFLASAVPYFPDGTIHVAVIDPGVGTKRQGMVARIAGQRLVCPDNGLLTMLSHTHPLEGAWAIQNPEFVREPISPTFHGRDVFAPAAGTMAAGMAAERAGAPLESIHLLRVAQPRHAGEKRIEGQIIHVDRFGNLITNIHKSLLNLGRPMRTQAGSYDFNSLSRTFADVPPEDPLALIGSTNHIEIAVNLGNAGEFLGLRVGDAVSVEWD